jgi:hypothetical protein
MDTRAAIRSFAPPSPERTGAGATSTKWRSRSPHGRPPDPTRRSALLLPWGEFRAVRLLPIYPRLSFTPGFWSFTFPSAAMATLGLRWLALEEPTGATAYAWIPIAPLTGLDRRDRPAHARRSRKWTTPARPRRGCSATAFLRCGVYQEGRVMGGWTKVPSPNWFWVRRRCSNFENLPVRC